MNIFESQVLSDTAERMAILHRTWMDTLGLIAVNVADKASSNVCSQLCYWANQNVQDATYEEVSTRIWDNICSNVTEYTDYYFIFK